MHLSAMAGVWEYFNAGLTGKQKYRPCFGVATYFDAYSCSWGMAQNRTNVLTSQMEGLESSCNCLEGHLSVTQKLVLKWHL